MTRQPFGEGFHVDAQILSVRNRSEPWGMIIVILVPQLANSDLLGGAIT